MSNYYIQMGKVIAAYDAITVFNERFEAIKGENISDHNSFIAGNLAQAANAKVYAKKMFKELKSDFLKQYPQSSVELEERLGNIPDVIRVSRIYEDIDF